MKQRKIAIACQGGGSQTAFTAGALKALFDNDVRPVRTRRRLIHECALHA